jgi:uncharacterized membrane protein YqiK
MQGEGVRSEQMVRITEKTALAVAEAARGEASATRARAEGDAAAVRMKGDAEGSSIRAVGAARAEAYRLGQEALGREPFVAVQLAAILGEHRVKLVPDIAVGGEGGSGRLADALVGRMLFGAAAMPPANGAEPAKQPG